MRTDLVELLAERGRGACPDAGWEAIDEAERALGEPHGRPRIKLCTWDDLLTAARNCRRARSARYRLARTTRGARGRFRCAAAILDDVLRERP